MPYISTHQRHELDKAIRACHGALAHEGYTKGNLTYLITKIINDYLTHDVNKAPNFDAFANAIAVLECTKLELYRRPVAQYEDHKRTVNGEVYSPIVVRPMD